jgi:hypothetical protein
MNVYHQKVITVESVGSDLPQWISGNHGPESHVAALINRSNIVTILDDSSPIYKAPVVGE